jgi:pyruvate kinase
MDAAGEVDALRRSSSVLYQSAMEKGKKLKTRIICTIGPKSNNIDTLCEMLDAGMCVVRLNTAHGDFDFHQSIIDNTRKACEKRGTLCAILIDIKGPEIRTGKMKPNPARENKKEWVFQKGTVITITVADKATEGDDKLLFMTYKKLPQIAKPKMTRILVADGLLGLSVISSNLTDTVTCLVENNAVIGENKNVNIPDEIIDLPAVTEKDKEFVEFAVKNKLDFIAGSFIRKAQDIKDIRALPGVKESNFKIIAKIENREGIDNFDEILAETDGVMVARGDMGVEISLPEVTTVQKQMIAKCNVAGKPVITATQMLESMIQNPRPTRAEVADVFNAVIDGTDCVMLSGETAMGGFPVESVKIMGEICIEAEAQINYRELFLKLREMTAKVPKFNVPESVTSSAVKTSWDLQASLIVALSVSGNTARLVSKYRPHSPIVCITDSRQVAQQLLVTRGVYPYLVEKLSGVVEKTAEQAIMRAWRDKFVQEGDYIVVTSGAVEGVKGGTSMLRVAQIENGKVAYALA